MSYDKSENYGQGLVRYVDGNGRNWELDPDSPLAQRRDMRRDETTWDRIRNRFL